MFILNKDKMEIHYGDCLCPINGLSTIADKSIDMILCDLPYGTTANKWDKELNLEALFKEYNRIIKDNGAIVLFGSQPFTTDLINANRKYFRYELILDKTLGTNFLLANKRPLKRHENILIFYKKQPVYNPQKTEGKPYKRPQTRSAKNTFVSFIGSKVYADLDNKTGLRHPTSILNFIRETGLHSTQKPVALCEWLINTYTNKGDLVLDNCMGSGTTAIACLNTERRFIGWEKDEHYYEVAFNRIFDKEN